jgi:hypothetical protein
MQIYTFYLTSNVSAKIHGHQMPVEFPDDLKDDTENVTCDKKNVTGDIWECLK